MVNDGLRRWVYRLSCLGLLVHMVVATSVIFGQSQETINARQQYALDSLERRLDRIDREDLPTRTKVLESDMYEVKWLARGVALAVMGQLVMAGLGLRDERRRTHGA